MSEKDCGGPAFPRTEPASGMDGERVYFGMTLRDYFAAKAMQGFCMASEADDDVEVIPELSYAMADAMLRAREGK